MIIYNTKLYHHPTPAWKRRLSCFTNCLRRRCCLNDNCCFKQTEPLFSFSCANVDGNRLKLHNLGKNTKYRTIGTIQSKLCLNWAFGQLSKCKTWFCLFALMEICQNWSQLCKPGFTVKLGLGLIELLWRQNLEDLPADHYERSAEIDNDPKTKYESRTT